MALTRIRTGSILDREVREQDLADGAVSFSKINVSAPALPGYVLTTDGAGNLVWNSPTGASVSLETLTDVDVTTVPPTLDQVLAFDGVDTWRPLSIPGLGSSSNTYVVDDIAARNALTPNEGDSCYVRTGASGEYEMYVYDAGWVLLATQDSARSDANTIEYTIAYTPTPGQVTIGNISAGSRVTIVTVDIDAGNEFDGPGVTFSVGDAGDPDRLIDLPTYIDLETEGSYVCQPDYVYASATDTDILLTYDFGIATTGTARVVVTHV